MQTINVRKIYSALTSVFVNALPGWYVFTGCIYEPSFHGKGRKSSSKKVRNFSVTSRMLAMMTSYAKQILLRLKNSHGTKIYGTKNSDVNDARFILFKKSFGSTNNINFAKKGNFVELLRIIFLRSIEFLQHFY